MENGVIASLNQTLDQETAAIIVEMVGHKYELLNDDDLEKDLQDLQTGSVEFDGTAQERFSWRPWLRTFC